MNPYSDHALCAPSQKTDAQLAQSIADLVLVLNHERANGRPIWTVADCLAANTAEQRRRHYGAKKGERT